MRKNTLKTDPVTNETKTDYQYDVIMFGTWDANNKQDLTESSRNATEAFSKAGGGLMFGHDTLTQWDGVSARSYFKRFAEPDFLNISMANQATTYLSTKVKVVNTGFLTSRPWNLEQALLTIPQTHMLGQTAGGDSARFTQKHGVDAASRRQREGPGDRESPRAQLPLPTTTTW